MLLNRFPPITKFNTKNVKINNVRVKIKIIISIEKASLDYLDIVINEQPIKILTSDDYLLKSYLLKVINKKCVCVCVRACVRVNFPHITKFTPLHFLLITRNYNYTVQHGF